MVSVRQARSSTSAQCFCQGAVGSQLPDIEHARVVPGVLAVAVVLRQFTVERLQSAHRPRNRCSCAADSPLALSRIDIDRGLGQVRHQVGITEYLRNGGKLEIAQQMANHESSRTTGLYDRRQDQVSLDEVERIVI